MLAAMGIRDIRARWICPSCHEQVEAALVVTSDSVGFYRRYIHTVKSDDTPCMISVNTVDTNFAVVGKPGESNSNATS